MNQLGRYELVEKIGQGGMGVVQEKLEKEMGPLLW